MTSPLAPFEPALLQLAAALREVDWRLGGSAMLAALGLSDEVGDLDVTVPSGALDEVRRGCAAWIVEESIGDAPPPWCSDWLVRLDLGGVEVDVIGDFCVITELGRVAVPQELGGHLDVAGVAIPLADPALWWWIYEAYRPAKAALLAEVIPAARRAQVIRRLGPPARP